MLVCSIIWEWTNLKIKNLPNVPNCTFYSVVGFSSVVVVVKDLVVVAVVDEDEGLVVVAAVDEDEDLVVVAYVNTDEDLVVVAAVDIVEIDPVVITRK